MYYCEVLSAEGCEFIDSVQVDVYFDPPVPVMPDVVNMCENGSVQITVSGGDTYLWYPDQNISSTTNSTVTVSPPNDLYYYCDFINACGFVTDSVLVDVVAPVIVAGNDTIICPGQTASLWASGGVSYLWSPTSTIVGTSSGPSILVKPNQNTTYIVTGMDQYGCTAQDSVIVQLFPTPFIQTTPDVYAMYGDVIVLGATSSTPGIYNWSPAELVSCVTCTNPTTSPNENAIITVSYTDENGCSASDNVHIYYDPILYIPNTFTPDGDEFNNEFRVIGANIQSFEIWIYNRWGELVYSFSSFDDYWDGTYKGRMCQDGTYTWKIRYYDFSYNEYEQTGHVNLLK
jgi:gliding motility-associated-like protein